jgi:pre-mRNA-splicing factor 38A
VYDHLLVILLVFICVQQFKYLRLLGAFYLRMVGTPIDIYTHLEPLYTDYRKVAYRDMQGWELRHVDDFVESLLNDEHCCSVSLPHLPKRHLLEESGSLPPRESKLEGEMMLLGGDDSDEEEIADVKSHQR